MEMEMAQTFEDLFAVAKELGLTDQSAAEMANEHIARRYEIVPRYVRAHLNAAVGGVISCRKVQKFLDRKFGWNSDNVHRLCGAFVARTNMGDWRLA